MTATIKIIDTCTLINIFEEIDIDLGSALEKYYVIITQHVVSEYTRKMPRPIPKYLSVVGMNEDDRSVMDETEFLFPYLGVGERSVFVMALNAAATGEKVVGLTDDKKALKKFPEAAKSMEINARFPGSKDIIWGDTLSLIRKLAADGKIPRTHIDIAKRALKR